MILQASRNQDGYTGEERVKSKREGFVIIVANYSQIDCVFDEQIESAQVY